MTTSFCFYSNKELPGSSENVKRKSYLNFKLFSPNYSHTIMNLNKYLCCRKNMCNNNTITLSCIFFFLTVQVTFILSLTVITNPQEARISCYILKSPWGFGAFKESTTGHTVRYYQSLVWVQNSSLFTDSTKACALWIHYIQSQDSPGHLEHSDKYNTLLL